MYRKRGGGLTIPMTDGPRQEIHRPQRSREKVFKRREKERGREREFSFVQDLVCIGMNQLQEPSARDYQDCHRNETKSFKDLARNREHGTWLRFSSGAPWLYGIVERSKSSPNNG